MLESVCSSVVNGEQRKSKMKMEVSKREKRLLSVFKEYGYMLTQDGDNRWFLFSLPIPGFASGQSFGQFKSVQSAADFLCPIIHDDSFTLQIA